MCTGKAGLAQTRPSFNPLSWSQCRAYPVSPYFFRHTGSVPGTSDELRRSKAVYNSSGKTQRMEDYVGILQISGSALAESATPVCVIHEDQYNKTQGE